MKKIISFITMIVFCLTTKGQTFEYLISKDQCEVKEYITEEEDDFIKTVEYTYLGIVIIRTIYVAGDNYILVKEVALPKIIDKKPETEEEYITTYYCLKNRNTKMTLLRYNDTFEKDSIFFEKVLNCYTKLQ